jgi:hypothetical protein
MREWLRKLELVAVGVAFAEQGEWRMAQSVVNECNRRPAKRSSKVMRDHRIRQRGNSYRV